jgi:pimeloyl-ACP methyl ester carboxylesterase
VALAYDEQGSTHGPVVLCLPMLGTTRGLTAQAFSPALTGAGVREVYLDLPGHGPCAGSSEPTSEAVLAEVLGLVERLAGAVGAPLLLAGASYGAYLAQAVARRRPDLVRGLLLVCAGVVADPARRRLPDDVGPTEAGWLDHAAPRWRAHLDRALGARTAAVAEHVSRLLDAHTEGDERFQDALRGNGFSLSDEASDHALTVPVAVLAGRQDRVAGWLDPADVASRHPSSTLVVADRAGHYLPFEQPGLLRAAAQDWLTRCGVGARQTPA